MGEGRGRRGTFAQLPAADCHQIHRPGFYFERFDRPTSLLVGVFCFSHTCHRCLSVTSLDAECDVALHNESGSLPVSG